MRGWQGNREQEALGSAGARAGEPHPECPPSLTQGARLGCARRLRREPALATRSSSGQPCVKPEPRPGGGRGAGTKLASACSLPGGERTRCGRKADPGTGRGEKREHLLGGRDSLGLGGADSRNRGKGACFPGFGTERCWGEAGGTRGTGRWLGAPGKKKEKGARGG